MAESERVGACQGYFLICINHTMVSDRLLELKHEFQKARNAIERKIRKSSPSPSAVSATTAAAAAVNGSTTVSNAFLQPPNSSTVSSTPSPVSCGTKLKVKMPFALASLLVYTVGVKCRGLNKKEHYAPEHVFSLSENTANKIIRQGLVGDLIKHNRTHAVRIYPKGLRLKSTNYEPHRYWAVGAQLVAINWQTFGGCVADLLSNTTTYLVSFRSRVYGQSFHAPA